MNFKEALNNVRAFAFDVDGVLSANCITLDSNGEPMRMANIKDGYAIQLAAKLGYPIAIITGARTPSIKYRYEALGVSDVYLAASHKTVQFADFLSRHNLNSDDVLYMGDDIPDMGVMKECGLATAPADAAMEIKAISHYVSDRCGGGGCVRDVIEQVLRVQGHWMSTDDICAW